MPLYWRSIAQAQRYKHLQWVNTRLGRLGGAGDSHYRKEKLRYIALCRSEQYEKMHWRSATSANDYVEGVLNNIRGLEADVLRALNMCSPPQHDAAIKLEEGQFAQLVTRRPPLVTRPAVNQVEYGDAGCARCAGRRAARDRVEQRRSRLRMEQRMQRLAAVPEGDELLEFDGCGSDGVDSWRWASPVPSCWPCACEKKKSTAFSWLKQRSSSMLTSHRRACELACAA